jgi:hypothetical protein
VALEDAGGLALGDFAPAEDVGRFGVFDLRVPSP